MTIKEAVDAINEACAEDPYVIRWDDLEKGIAAHEAACRAYERSKIVAWLREYVTETDSTRSIADAIDRGEHQK